MAAFPIFLKPAQAASPLTVSVPMIPSASQGQPYTSGDGTANGAAILTISGGTGPYICSVATGSLPSGMSLSEVTPNYAAAGLCLLTGTPSAAGDFTFTVQVNDSASNTAGQSVTFPVKNSSPPVISQIAATSVSATSETITWTTDTAASSKVCYSLAYGMRYCTPEQDTAGVTSHSVTITGLFGGTGYGYYVISRGISGGAPRDYLVASVGNPDGVSGGFTTANPPNTGTLDFNQAATGPHNVLQGYPMEVGIYAEAISVAGSPNQVRIVVTNIPPNTQVAWPDASGTIGTTYTTNDTLLTGLGTGGAGGFTFRILQNVGGTTPTGNYTLTVTMTSVPGSGSSAQHSFTWAMNVITSPFVPGSPSSYPAIPSKSVWESNMTTYGATWCNGGNPPHPPADEQGVWYYDGMWVFQQMANYTGNTATWVPCSQAVRTQYRENYVILNTDHGGWRVFPHGLYDDCKVNGNSTSCTALHSLAAGWAFTSGGQDQLYTDSSDIREVCYALGAKRLDYDAGLGTTLAQVQQWESYCLGIVDQVVNGTGEQPFMNGLAAQALIDYYMDPKTGNQSDPRVPWAIQQLADHMWAVDWLPYAGTNGTFFYNRLDFNNGLGNDGVSPVNLNLLIAPMYAWLFKMTGDPKYQLEGDTIWSAGVNGNAGNGVGWSGKNFSQQYRWSFDYVKWRSGASTPPPSLSPCDVNGDGVTNVADVQLEVNMALGISPCSNPSGTCTVASVQRVVNAALGGTCVIP
jgi:hypothetical protein